MLLPTQTTLIGFWFIIKAFIILGLTAFIGIVAFRILYGDKKINWMTLVGGGMVTGPLLFLFSLGFLNYLFRGQTFLTVLFIFFVISALYLVKKTERNLFSELFYPKIKDKNKSIKIAILIALNILLIYVFVGKANVGGDVLQYWAIATSFARGNYPTVMPYQPDFLAVYHTGTYWVMGLIYTLTQLDIDKVHFFFAFYILTSIFLLTAGMALKKNYSVFCLIPPIFGLILFGGPVILTKFNYQLQNIFSVITQYPTFDINIGSIGGGAISTESLIYIIHITFGLAVFLLFIYTLIERDKKNPLKDYILLTLLTNLNLSINEVFLPIQLFLMGIFFIYDYRKQKLKKILVSGTTIALIFASLFFIIQNSVRDSLLTPSPEAPRFQIVIPPFKDIAQFTNPLHPPPYQDIVVSTDGKGTNWYLLDIRILILLVLVLSLASQEIIPLVLGIGALISLLCKIFIWYTFSPWSGFRFFSQSYQLVAFALGFLVVGLVKEKKLRFIAFLILFLLLPQIVSSYVKILNISLKATNQNYTSNNSENTSLKKIANFIPAKSRLLIISFLPSGDINHSLSSDALIRYGLIIPLGPTDAKILNIATGIEWYDAATYLDPSSIKRLGVDYVYLDDGASKFLADERVKEIHDVSYFKLALRTTNGVLYEVADSFKSLQDEGSLTLRKMVSQIKNNKTVYLDTINGDIRRLMFLSLARKHSRLFGRGYLDRFGGDYYMAVEIPFVQITEDVHGVDDIEYAVMRPGLNPSDFIYGKYRKIAETKFAYLWKRKD